MNYPACAALERKKQRFLYFGDPKTRGGQWKLDCKSGAAVFFLAADVSKKWYSRHGEARGGGHRLQEPKQARVHCTGSPPPEGGGGGGQAFQWVSAGHTNFQSFVTLFPAAPALLGWVLL